METSPALTEAKSVCPLDCPDTCSLTVKTDGAKIVEVRGSSDNPYTAGVICNKVARSYPEFVHGSTRLRTPLRRIGAKGSGEFEAMSWEDALDAVHAGFSKAISAHGPQSVLPLNYSGPHGELACGSMDRRFFYKLGATLLNRGPLCGIVRGTAYSSLFGTGPGMAPEQAQFSDLIIVWGNNVTVSNLHLARVIKTARAQGAKLVVIDPKRTKIAEQADLYIQIEPGTDVVLALALAAELERLNAFDYDFIERWVEGFDAYMTQARQHNINDASKTCGIDAKTFRQLISWYRQAENVAVSIGNGIERGRSGGSGLRAAMALQALTGNHGRLGAGVLAKPGFAFAKTPDRLQRPDLIPDGTRTFNIVDVAKHVLDETLDPPIAAMMIYNHNPVATHPDQNRMRRALARDNLFIVGSDVVMTDSMKYADIILPASSHFEFPDIYGSYGHSYLQRAEAVIPCVGDSLPNTEIFRRLAARFGFDEALFKASDSELMDEAFDNNDPRLNGSLPSEISLDSALAMTTSGGEPMIMCKTVSPATKSGKIELFSDDLEKRFGYGLPRFEPVTRDLPFSIISPSSSKRTNATFGGCSQSHGPEIVEINPADAEEYNIKEGDSLRVWNSQGEVHLTAHITDAVPARVLYSPKGTWLATSSTDQTVNALISSQVRTDIEEGACYNETFVDIAPASA
jgi:anaerobic selenocysteine-containing dehydrogenase